MYKDLKNFFEKRWLILAPMAGVNDPIFRQLCIENGAMLTYTEMVSSKALSYKNPKTKNLLQLSSNEDKVVVQLFGHEPQTMASEAHNIEVKLGDKLAYIDINMACPARKIVKKGDGASLMKDAKLAAEIVKACNEACTCGVSVKIRRGYNEGEDTAYDFARKMQDAGASAIAIHGRYATQFYKGASCFESVRAIAESVSIPVIYSGDIKSYSSAKDIVKNTSICAVMIGRAARGNPWVFSKNATYSMQKKIDIAKYHVVEYDKLNHAGLSHMRKHCMWYCKGMPGASAARNGFSSCKSVDDYLSIFDSMC